jgi:serine/threonine protein kinase
MTSFGQYQLQEVLGRGGMGQVFRAYDTATHRVVALKVLPPHLAEDAEFQERFRREARIAASLSDPHVVPIHGYGEIDGQLYVDMRLIEGRDLVRFIAENGGRLSAAQAVAVIEQVAAALDSAHQVELVHRDVKPSNILVAAARDFVYLIDFGIARATADTAMTNTWVTMGTLAYMAPERFRGTTDPRADVYSLACVLYECLTGRRPYPGDTLEEQLTGHLHTPPPRPSTTAPEVPAAFDAVIARGMAKDLHERYQSTVELASAAKEALTGPADALASSPPPSSHASPQPAPDSPPQPQQRQAGSSRRRLILGVVGGSVVALAAAAGLVVALVTNSHTPAKNSAGSSSPTRVRPSRPPMSTGSVASNVPPLPAFAAPASLGANCQYPPSPDPASRPVNPPRSGKVSTDPAQIHATISTNFGDIGIQLANAESPCTVNSFTSLAQQQFFNNTPCGRLTTAPDLSLLQCGGPENDGSGGPGYEFDDEYPTNQYSSSDRALTQPVLYPRGAVTMANGNKPNTNESQFNMVYRDSELEPAYTVFGTIDETGLATIDKIASAGVSGGGNDGAPATPVTINAVRLG